VRRIPAWTVPLLFLAGLTALYWTALSAPFLNDDFLFLEEARTRTLAASLSDLGALGNYYRPLSRQIYFELLTPIGGGDPRVFHLVNFALFLGALALLADLLRALLPRPGVWAGCLYFALLPFQRVNLMWISCSQDLLAMVGCLGALACHRRGLHAIALLSAAAAFASKEVALALPLGLVAWERYAQGRAWNAVLRATWRYFVLAGLWSMVALAMRARNAAAAPLQPDAGNFLAALVHALQSALGLDNPTAFLPALLRVGPALLPLACFVAIAFALPPTSTDGSSKASTRTILSFGFVWLAAFALPVGPVVYSWSGYHFTLAAVGTAVLVGFCFRRADGWTWAALAGILLWWHSAATGRPAGRDTMFAVTENPWIWTSHLTSQYFDRVIALTSRMKSEMRRVVPTPAPHTRFFFVTLPPYAGFQMGNGALIRALYRDSTLASHFYTRFSDSTAADHPVEFLYWDGSGLARLYPRATDLYFQVGTDLLLQDEVRGATHAFRRALISGESRLDNLYWLGWAELWSDRRSAAEAAWQALGARDDSVAWNKALRKSRDALMDRRDTLEARRLLNEAIQTGIGRPEAHAVLGTLMFPVNAKYGMLELKVAAWLNPRDWLSRRDLAVGYADMRLETPARRELEKLVTDFPQLASDPAVVRVQRSLSMTPRIQE
jgi:hypothetical protein